MVLCECVCVCVCECMYVFTCKIQRSEGFLPLLSPFPSSLPPQLASQLYSQDAESQQTDTVINQLRQVVATLQTRLFEEHVQVS